MSNSDESASQEAVQVILRKESVKHIPQSAEFHCAFRRALLFCDQSTNPSLLFSPSPFASSAPTLLRSNLVLSFALFYHKPLLSPSTLLSVSSPQLISETVSEILSLEKPFDNAIPSASQSFFPSPSLLSFPHE